jgi:hypothetical protein
MSRDFATLSTKLLRYAVICGIIATVKPIWRSKMENSRTYEKIVKVALRGKQTAKIMSIIGAYAVFFAIWLLAALSTPSVFLPIIVTGALCTLLLVLVTRKYLSLEYEYSFWYGQLSVSKIYGKTKRKTLVEADMKALLMIAPATEEYIAKAEHFNIKSRIIAVSSEQADNIWLAVTGDEDLPHRLIFFEADDRSLGILKAANNLAFIKKAL